MKPFKATRGYLRVALYKNKKRKQFSVHRLVAEVFLPNPLGKPEVNHKWGIKTDNRASELEWNTSSENQKHAYKNKLKIVTEKQKAITKEICSKKVLQYDLQGNLIREWASQLEVRKNLKISNGNIASCCKGKRKTAGGFIWRYKDT